jgi:hypothetical protein
MAALPEDCPCCDADAEDLDASMIQAFLSGYIAARKAAKIPDVLCERHLRLADNCLQFVETALKAGAH